MSLTALKIEKTGEPTKYLQFMTQPDEEKEGVIVVIRECDENYDFVGKSDRGMDDKNEEAYHTALRIKAAERNQLITNFSTDPQWNPEGYENIHEVKNQEDGSN